VKKTLLSWRHDVTWHLRDRDCVSVIEAWPPRYRYPDTSVTMTVSITITVIFTVTVTLTVIVTPLHLPLQLPLQLPWPLLLHLPWLWPYRYVCRYSYRSVAFFKAKIQEAFGDEYKAFQTNVLTKIINVNLNR
jgi:hypothetical protein